MDAIERDLRTYGGLIAASRVRAEGIRKLAEQKPLKDLLEGRGVDLTTAKKLDGEAKDLAAELEQVRQIWAELQQRAARMRARSAKLADEIRAMDDAARAALGRKSEHLPVLGIRPRRQPSTRASVVRGMLAAGSASAPAASRVK